MLFLKAPDLRWSEVTDKRLYVGRRNFLRTAAAATAAVAASDVMRVTAAQRSWPRVAVPPPVHDSGWGKGEARTPYRDVTTHNNFYEFGPEKTDPSENAHTLRTKPWTVKVDGLAGRPGNYPLDDLVKPHVLEERIYRMRCVERWSMVIPWIGIPLSSVLKRFEPQPSAKFVEFTTLLDLQQMPGQRRDVLEWPFTEGLRLDEAMHPLTILAVGLYGEYLPNQNGAPLRLVVPWKYGFKGIKSIVRIRLTDRQPMTAWSLSDPREYGFFANVNPDAPHSRWSQARERRIGDFFLRPTLMFNGYGEQVASMYSGMDLKKYF